MTTPTLEEPEQAAKRPERLEATPGNVSRTKYWDEDKFELIKPLLGAIYVRKLRERLLARTLRDDGLDWDALDNAWGTEPPR